MWKRTERLYGLKPWMKPPVYPDLPPAPGDEIPGVDC